MAAVEEEPLSPRIRYVKALSDAGYSDFLVLDREGAEKVLTEKRMELLETIRENSPESVSELAESVDRELSAVSRDLTLLEENTVVEYEESGGRKKPVLGQRYIFVEPVMEPID